MLNAVNNVLADVSSVSPSSEELRIVNCPDEGITTQNVSQYILYGVQRTHINLSSP